ncbi:MAG: hypothetical protein KAR42_06580 [candidate division Zixibacteria bacterium]|nr:hypothetical protein [candidate division Zixibacteria bacterium]
MKRNPKIRFIALILGLLLTCAVTNGFIDAKQLQGEKLFELTTNVYDTLDALHQKGIFVCADNLSSDDSYYWSTIATILLSLENFTLFSKCYYSCDSCKDCGEGMDKNFITINGHVSLAKVMVYEALPKHYADYDLMMQAIPFLDELIEVLKESTPFQDESARTYKELFMDPYDERNK